MEAAFVLPILILFLVGIIEFGQIFRKSLTMSEATRSGARLGVAQPRQPGYQDNVSVAVRETLRKSAGSGAIEYLSIYRADPATGDPIDGSGPDTCLTCYRYTWDDAAKTWIPVSGSSWPALTQYACGDVTDTDYMGVYVRGRHDMSTSFIPGSLTLEEQTVMRLEPLPLADECKPG